MSRDLKEEREVPAHPCAPENECHVIVSVHWRVQPGHHAAVWVGLIELAVCDAAVSGVSVHKGSAGVSHASLH